MAATRSPIACSPLTDGLHPRQTANMPRLIRLEQRRRDRDHHRCPTSVPRRPARKRQRRRYRFLHRSRHARAAVRQRRRSRAARPPRERPRRRRGHEHRVRSVRATVAAACDPRTLSTRLRSVACRHVLRSLHAALPGRRLLGLGRARVAGSRARAVGELRRAVVRGSSVSSRVSGARRLTGARAFAACLATLDLQRSDRTNAAPSRSIAA